MTSGNLFSAIDYFLNNSPYYPCLLLVHPEIIQLDVTCRQILGQYSWPSLSVGTVVSQALLLVSSKQRSRQAKQALTDAVRMHAPGPLLCTDVDLLFEPSLTLDPLRLFREISRQTTLVLLWPGAFAGSILAYATHLHAHYRTWDQTDLCDYCIITL